MSLIVVLLLHEMFFAYMYLINLQLCICRYYIGSSRLDLFLIKNNTTRLMNGVMNILS